jgi:hypothetical protein
LAAALDEVVELGVSVVEEPFLESREKRIGTKLRTNSQTKNLR